jgi:hypothetical protein
MQPQKAHNQTHELQFFPWELVEHSLSSCDLAPLNYNLIGPWKQYLGDGLIHGNEEMEMSVHD